MQLRSVQDLGKDIEMANWVGYYRVFTGFRCEVPKADRFYWVFTEFRGRPKYSIVITLVMEKKSFTLNEFLLGFELKKKTKNKNALPSFTEFRGQSKDERWMQRGQIKVSLGPNFTGFYRVLRIHQESVYRVWPNFEMEGAPKKNELKKNGSSHRVFTGFLPGFSEIPRQ